MIDAEVATLLEIFAEKVIRLPGVSRTKPHAFAEAKSELRGELLQKAAELRCVKPAVAVRDVPTGIRTIGPRRIVVVSKSRR